MAPILPAHPLSCERSPGAAAFPCLTTTLGSGQTGLMLTVLLWLRCSQTTVQTNKDCCENSGEWEWLTQILRRGVVTELPLGCHSIAWPWISLQRRLSSISWVSG